jgi:hypothetical protein
MSVRAPSNPNRRVRGEGGVFWNEKRQRFVATRVVGYTDRGKEIRKTGYGKSKTAALDSVKRLVREYERGLSPGSEKSTVSDAVRDRLLYGQGQVDDETVRKREFMCAHIDAGIGDVLLRRLMAKHWRSCSPRSSRRTRRGPSPTCGAASTRRSSGRWHASWSSETSSNS